MAGLGIRQLNFRCFKYGERPWISASIAGSMLETATVELQELMGLATSLAEKAGTSTDESEKTNLLKNLRFLLNLADDAIVREFPVE